MIYKYMEQKGLEYAKFDPFRVRKLFVDLKKNLNLNSKKIHIIGTNGKGSTGRFITQSLFEAGYSVLHFTSPHIFEFRERFYKNNKIISLKVLEDAHIFLQNFDFMSKASYFEYAFFLALVIGDDCEYLVMEAGLGGEYDATNVLKYDISVYTRIGIDHKEFLGNNIEDIAKTKLRAMRGEVFFHFLESNIQKIAEEIFKSNCNLCSFIKEMINEGRADFFGVRSAFEEIHDSCEVFRLSFLESKDLDFVKSYSQKYNLYPFLKENLALANKVLSFLNIPLLTKELDLKGRMQKINNNIWVDVGHNEMAAQNVKSIFSKKFNLIYNSYKEKEIKKILEILKPNINKILILEITDNDRVISLLDLEIIIKELEIEYEIFTSNFRFSDNEVYLAFGGFALVQNFLLWYENTKDTYAK